ncbi:hypothetical protein MLD38_002224 [Melastoma candidum]|uniref:Uncharacterized protein n=1 Tax=Melastoma candidum TaxID=119954 RepID=A0ACB9SFW3_9MYRT|nr:hypothetical protein MLD38_002224 [Melastoma candidum]
MGSSVFCSVGSRSCPDLARRELPWLPSSRPRWTSSHARVSLWESRPRRKSITCGQHEPTGFKERASPNEVRKEINRCYELIRRVGRGVVYLGSSRMGPGHDHYSKVFDLSFQVAKLLNCTTWSGAGPGLMDAVTMGASDAGLPVAGLKIGKEAGEWTVSSFHPYLPAESYLTCRFFSARKHGLVDAAVRNRESDRTAVIALPGGIGTLDEMFEIMALIQLERIGSTLPVPFLLMNYDSFYSKLLDFLDDCVNWGTIAEGEVASLWKVCDNNSDALTFLSEFYNLPLDEEVVVRLQKSPK